MADPPHPITTPLSGLPPELCQYNLWNWIIDSESGGIYLHPSLTIMYNPAWKYGIGAASTVGLQKDTVVARIPKSHILSIRTCTHDLLRHVLGFVKFDGIVGLTLAYMYESTRKEQSHFAPYLAMFNLPDVPRIWRERERAYLVGTEVAYTDTYSTVWSNSCIVS
jgi:hypothetical protein